MKLEHWVFTACMASFFKEFKDKVERVGGEASFFELFLMKIIAFKKIQSIREMLRSFKKIGE